MSINTTTTITDMHSKLCNKLKAAKIDILKAQKGQKAGGIRARKALVSAGHDIKKLRKEVMKIRRVHAYIKQQRKKADDKNTTNKKV